MDDFIFLREKILTQAIQLKGSLSFDFRVLLSTGSIISAAGRLMWGKIKKYDPDVLIGPGFGAMPLLFSTAAAALNDGIDLKILMIRDQRKTYHQKKWVEGNALSCQGKRAVIIDDFMQGGSVLALVSAALKADKVDVNLVAACIFFDMWEPLGSRQIQVSQFPIETLFKRHDIGLSRDCFDAAPPLMQGSAPSFIKESMKWWRFGLNKNNGYSGKCAPTISGRYVYVADDQSTLWCHDLVSGEIIWSIPSLEKPLKGIVQKLEVVDGCLIYGCYDGTLTKVDAVSGVIIWRYKLDSSIHATPYIDTENNQIYINTEQWNQGSPTGHLQCLKLDTGEVLWKLRHQWWPPASASYCKSNNIVISPCNNGDIVGCSALTGEILWRFQTLGLVRGRALVEDGKVWIATERGRLYCLDVKTGSKVWSRRYGLGAYHQFLTSRNNRILVVDGKWNWMGFCKKTGDLKWITRLRSAGVWAPIFFNQYAVMLSKHGHLAVMNLTTEKKVWEGKIPGVYHQPPAVDVSQNGIFVAASTTDGLLAFDINSYYLN